MTQRLTGCLEKAVNGPLRDVWNEKTRQVKKLLSTSQQSRGLALAIGLMGEVTRTMVFRYEGTTLSH